MRRGQGIRRHARRWHGIFRWGGVGRRRGLRRALPFWPLLTPPISPGRRFMWMAGSVCMPSFAKIGRRNFDDPIPERMVRYADDFVILCASQEEAALHQAEAWVSANSLSLHPDKTRIGNNL